ncbi:Cytochrome P450 2D9 [Folsomia candida]|uniref:Cytochrome P450 2D9 n=1 Tax=Folsomia candida TaxID=158441 RepID=A0A226DIH6_FOLCA|nr:Cytochrome P450 2D9 [Folsomia candida]
MFVYFALAIGSFLIIYYFLLKDDRDCKEPPGPKPWPLLGNLPDLFMASDNMTLALGNLAEKYGEIYSLKMGSKKTVVLTSKEAMQTILSNEATFARDFSGMWVDRSFRKNLGIAFSEGEVWETLRPWTFKTLKDFGFGKSSEMERFIKVASQRLFGSIDDKMGSPKTSCDLDVQLLYNDPILSIMWQMIVGRLSPEDEPSIKILSEKGDAFLRTSVFGAGIVNAFPFLRRIFPNALGYNVQMDFFKECNTIAQGHDNIEDEINGNEVAGQNNEQRVTILSDFKVTNPLGQRRRLHAAAPPDARSILGAAAANKSYFLFLQHCGATPRRHAAGKSSKIDAADAADKYIGVDLCNGPRVTILTFHLQNLFTEMEEKMRKLRMITPINLLEAFVQNSIKDSKIFNCDNFLLTFQDMLLTSTDTSNTFMEIVILYLITYPDVQEKVYEEILKVSPDGRDLSYSDRIKMPYIQAFFLETHRKGQPLQNLVPRRALSDIEYKDYIIKKDTIIMSDTRLYYENKEDWIDPEVFRPERFLDKAGQVVNAGKIISFSFGKRNCPGELQANIVAFLGITSLLQRYKLSVPKGQQMPRLDMRPGLTLKPYPFQATFAKRQ